MKKILAVTLLLFSTMAFSQPIEEKVLTEVIPPSYVDLSDIFLVVERIERTEDHAMVYVRLGNPTQKDLQFFGYSETAPWHEIKKLKEGMWTDYNVGWFCGTGLRICTIKGGDSSVIQAYVPNEIFPVKIGVGYAIEENIEKVWTEEIMLNQVAHTTPAIAPR